MAEIVGSTDYVNALLVVKAVIAVLAVALFVYYKFHWDRAKRILPIHYFYTKWRAVRHAVYMGMAALGFAIGFTLEISGVALGMSPTAARLVSSIFEICSLLAMLWVFFQLALEDVPHFAHIVEASHVPHYIQQVKLTPKKAKNAPKKRKKR